jgi:uncharacterized protein (DUF3820 family)
MSSKCRDCGKIDLEVQRFEFFKACTPRCIACGGSLDWIRSKKKKTKRKNKKEDKTNLRLTFGKYRGQTINYVPSNYLDWLLHQGFCPPVMLTEIEKLLDKREYHRSIKPDNYDSPLDKEYQEIIRNSL